MSRSFDSPRTFGFAKRSRGGRSGFRPAPRGLRGGAPQAVLRMIDANANRALEGMRVCEEVVRFYLSARRAFRRIRSLRHAIAQAITRLPTRQTELVQARASGRDIGRRASGSAVSSLERLLLINFQRVKESLRTLEECSRIIAPRQTASFQRLRFRAYEVERETLLRVATLRHR